MSEPNDIPAFCRAVAAAPNDDLPRLVFADWLEERDDEGENAPCRCRGSKHGAGKVEHVTAAGVLFVGDCDICKGSGRLFRSPNLFGKIGQFIRVQIELAKLCGPNKCYVCGMDYEDDLSKGGGIILPARSTRSPLVRHTRKNCDRCAGLLAQERGYGEEILQAWLMTHADQLGMRKVKIGVDTIIRPEPAQVRPGMTITPLDWSGRNGSLWVSFRRGFPDRVSMPLQSFYDSPVGARIVKKYPITEFRASDRQPQYFSRRRGTTPTYTFWRQDASDEAVNATATIPAELFDRFKAGDAGGELARNYTSHRSAMLDLSQAVLSAVRERAAESG